jgi:hypothetical protein
MLAALMLSLAVRPPAAAPSDDSDAVRPPVLSVRMLRGRASYVVPGSEDVVVITAGLEAPEFPDGVHLELGAGAEARFAWRELASARIVGPAAVSWMPKPPAPDVERVDAHGSDDRTGAAEAPPPELVLVVHGLRRGELEVRGAALVLELPAHGWRLEVPRSALHLETRVDERLAARHHGGGAVRVRNLARRPPGSWPTWIRPGDQVTLPLPLETGD